MIRLLVACLVALTMNPMTAGATSLVLRPGQALDHAVVDRLLADEIAALTDADGVRLRVRQPNLPLANPYQEDAVLRIDDLRLLPDDGFAARIAIEVGTAAPMYLTLEGDVARLIAVPLPVRGLPVGTFVAAEDLTHKLYAEHRIRADWIVDPAALIGMEARRPLLAGQPIVAAAIDHPQLVRRGDPVRLRFARGGLTLEAAGRAEGDGAMGAIVPARNEATGALLRGRVVGPRTLLVEPAR